MTSWRKTSKRLNRVEPVHSPEEIRLNSHRTAFPGCYQPHADAINQMTFGDVNQITQQTLIISYIESVLCYVTPSTSNHAGIISNLITICRVLSTFFEIVIRFLHFSLAGTTTVYNYHCPG